MKIVYLTHDINSKAGWGRFASELIGGIKRLGHEVVILKEKNDELEGELVLKRGVGMLWNFLKIRKYLNDCDIIHALDGYPYGISAALGNMGLNKKLIITAEGTYSVEPLYNFKISKILSWAYKKADKVVAISNYTKKEILKKIKLKNIVVVNPGIDPEKFLRPRVQTDENFVLSVGALKYRKGYHISIPAFAQVKKSIPDLKYKIVGSRSDSIYFNRLKELTRKHRMENSVEFLSNISDDELGKLYQTARLFILTSVNWGHQFEGFGLVFLEAAAAGLPVIGTRDNGIEDAVNNGVNGLLIPQSDVEATARAVSTILSDNDKWQNMSRESFEWAKNHDLGKVIKAYNEIYGERV